ncbi:MAG: ester cyclase [Roseiflexaceae bacterium]
MTIEDNTALVRLLFEALNVGMEAVNALRRQVFAPDEISTFAGRPLDYAAHAAFDAMLFAAFPDIQYTLEDLLAEGDRVVARFTARGTQRGVFQGIPATGSAAVVSGIAIYRLVSGKVVEQWLEYDQLGLLQQLGVIPALG